MGFRPTLNLELAIDEGSRFNSQPQDRFSILGCVFLPGSAAPALENAILHRGQFPKWRDATRDDVRCALDQLIHNGSHLRILKLAKDNPQSDSYKATATTVLNEDRLRTHALAPSQEINYPDNPEHLLRTAAIALVLTFEEVVINHAMRNKYYKYGDNLEVRVKTYIDKDSTPKSVQDTLVRNIFKTIEKLRAFKNGAISMRIRCNCEGVHFVRESERGSLQLIDYLCGIIAGATFPHYNHRNLAKNEIATWANELNEYGQATGNFKIQETSLSVIERLAKRAGEECRRDFDQLPPGPDILTTS